MLLLIWQFITFLLAALTLAMAFCHLLEMSPKMKYDAALYTTLQQTLYRNFGVPLGAAIETGAVILTIVLAILNRKGGSTFFLTAITASCYVVAFVIWFVRVAPANAEINKWTTTSVPANWTQWRNQWERAHAVRAVFFLLGFRLWFFLLSSDDRAKCGAFWLAPRQSNLLFGEHSSMVMAPYCR